MAITSPGDDVFQYLWVVGCDVAAVVVDVGVVAESFANMMQWLCAGRHDRCTALKLAHQMVAGVRVHYDSATKDWAYPSGCNSRNRV